MPSRKKVGMGVPLTTGQTAMGIKRILYVADSTSVHTQRWVRYFQSRGHETFIVTIGRKRRTLTGVRHVLNVHRFYYGSPSFLSTIRKVRRLVKEIRPHIVHAHNVHQYGWLGAVAGGRPFILTPWGTDILKLPYESRVKIGKWLTRYALNKADYINVISKYLGDECVRLGADPRKIRVFFLGVDTSKFRPDIEVESLREQLAIPSNAPVVLSNRNFSPLYNNDIVVEAMKNVMAFHPQAILVLQNAGEEQREETELKRLVERKGMAESVRFLPKYEHEDLPGLYAMSDIYVSVPSWDAGPLSLKEAMACHCAPVVSAIPAPMEWVRHCVNGRVVPVRNVEKLARAICELLDDPRERDRCNEINRRLIVEKAEHAKQMRKAEAMYDSAMSTAMKANRFE